MWFLSSLQVRKGIDNIYQSCLYPESSRRNAAVKADNTQHYETIAEPASISVKLSYQKRKRL